MILKLRIGNIRITFTIAPVVDVLGVNSKLPDGRHILMWDFDDMRLQLVEVALKQVQKEFHLPKIYILRTSPPNNYIAYCFQSCSWERARSIIGCTAGIDENFYKWGIFRRRFTLRVGEKTGITPQCVMILDSAMPETASIPELKSWVKYETLDGHHKQQVYILELP